MGKKINKKAKSIIIMSFVTTIFLILGTFVYLDAFSKSDEGKNIINNSGSLLKTPQGVTALVIIILGIVAFLFVLFIKIIRGKNVSKLNEDYDLAFEEIKQYIGVSPLSFTEKRELSNEILSLFLEAQSNGKTVDETIGSDHRKFISEMIKAYGVKNIFIYDLLTGLQYFLFYLIAVSILLFFETSEGYYSMKMDYSLILFFIISAFIIIPSINRNMRKSISNNNKTSSLSLETVIITIISVGGFLVLMRILRKYFIHISLVETFLNDGIVIIRSPFILALMIILIPSIYFIKKNMRNIDK